MGIDGTIFLWQDFGAGHVKAVKMLFMEDVRKVTGTYEAIWQQITNDLALDDVFDYQVLIEQDNRQVELKIDIDLGGGFEGGFELTTLTATINAFGTFKFALHKEDFFDEIGKFFGMQDVVVGDEEFDKHVVVKTNDEARLKPILDNKERREFFASLKDDFTFGITHHNHEKQLEFTIEKAVTEPALLRTLYHHFLSVLYLIDAS